MERYKKVILMDRFSLDLPSPVEQIVFRSEPFFLKRDDAIDADFSGNKARKFHYYLDHEFPDIHTVRSYGSNQSNAMYSLSVLARMRGWRFEYAVDHISDFLRKHPHGNYARALQNGMEIVEHLGQPDAGVLIIEEGGRQREAQYGMQIMAQEIVDWQCKQKIETLDVFLPSGTGTTALFLNKALLDLETEGLTTVVHTTPCVADAAYLRKQFAMLEPDTRYYPTILDLPHKYHFGKLYREFYEIWIELHQHTGVEFDLLYDPKGWMTLMAHRDRFGENVMYIHQGGILGNESMLPRYTRKYHD
jgi:1-aminocyclopropane-1-carboxylate deaminase/D-cysteine desulfhydrase-like pyridoxal-dependent ACC family enzyme